MTDYSKIPARELDARVAREVMGWTVVDRADWIRRGAPSGELVECDGEIWEAERVGSATTPFRPSTDGRAMLTVLDALRERGWRWSIDTDDHDCKVTVHERCRCLGYASAPSLPRAVALAALAAVGGK